MERIWILPVLVVLIVGSLGFSQDAFALNTFITDEPSCENAPVLGTFDSGTCVLSGPHTIPLFDNWTFQIPSKITGTVDVFGKLELRVSLSNSGTINVIGDTGGVGNRALLIFDFGTDFTNECNGIINLFGGTFFSNGSFHISGRNGLEPIFNNFGTITGTNSDIPTDQAVIILNSAPDIVTFNNHGTLTAPVVVGNGIFNDNLPDQCSIEVPPEEQAESLIEDVEALVDDETLNKGNGNALTKKLENAIKNIEQGNTDGACDKLGAFINQVNAFVNSGKLSLPESDDLISAATEIKDSIPC